MARSRGSEAAEPERRGPRGFVVSTRTRVLAWLLLVVGVAVLGSLLVSRQLLAADVDEQLDTELTHEASKFRAFAASDIDPRTGRRYASVGDLLARYLERNLPEGGETFFSLVDGTPQRRSPGVPDARLDQDPAFLDHVGNLTEPVSGTWKTSAGEAAYAALPVRLPNGGARGTLVVVEFRSEPQAQADHIVRLLLIASLISLALAGVVGWLVAGRVLAPVRAMRRTAEHITGSDLTDRIDVSGKDDVAALARTFNSMLDRLESAFTGQRQFLDDAGHELRTPITVIRGHLELLAHDPPDSSHDRQATLALVLDELGRMTRIVDDLLLLAKAEQPDFLELTEVDLADLAVDALANAQTLGDRQWTLDGFAEQTVVADGQRLIQALMQLADNAVRHTREGDVIAVGAAVEFRPRGADMDRAVAELGIGRPAGGPDSRAGLEDAGAGGEERAMAAAAAHPDARAEERVVLWVRDTGLGVADADRDRIFDRFYRGGSRKRAGEGAGLGLAIVARIAAAHGGHVTVNSQPGQGATFTLDLPLVGPPAPASQPTHARAHRSPVHPTPAATQPAPSTVGQVKPATSRHGGTQASGEPSGEQAGGE